MNTIKILALGIFLSLFNFVNAQSIGHDLEIFSEGGEKFTLFLNSRQMNEEPMSSILVTNTNNDYVQAKIVFENSEIPTIERKFLQIGEPGTQASRPVAAVYKIVNKKGSYKLNFASRSIKNVQPTQVIIQNAPAQNGRVVISW